MKDTKNNQRGFTLMVAMLVSTIVIVVGLGVSSIILRQFNLAVLSRESQSAFYSADTLIECVLYWDLKGKVFDKIFDGIDPVPPAEGFVCDHKDPNIDATISFDKKEEGEIPACAAGVRTYKKYEAKLILKSAKSVSIPVAYTEITKSQGCEIGDLYTIITQIDTNGYNSDRVGDTRKIERGLSLTY